MNHRSSIKSNPNWVYKPLIGEGRETNVKLLYGTATKYTNAETNMEEASRIIEDSFTNF